MNERESLFSFLRREWNDHRWSYLPWVAGIVAVLLLAIAFEVANRV